MKERATSQRLKKQTGSEKLIQGNLPALCLVSIIHHPENHIQVNQQEGMNGRARERQTTTHHTTRTTHTAACVFVLSGDQKKEILADLGFVGCGALSA